MRPLILLLVLLSLACTEPSIDIAEPNPALAGTFTTTPTITDTPTWKPPTVPLRRVRQPLIMRAGGLHSYGWLQDSPVIWQANVSVEQQPLWLLFTNMPAGELLEEVSIRWRGAPDHESIQGLALPQFELFAIDIDGEAHSLGAAQDSSATTAAYEEPHWVTITDIGHPISDFWHTYALVFYGEGYPVGAVQALPWGILSALTIGVPL